jgi:hypothetical protein
MAIQTRAIVSPKGCNRIAQGCRLSGYPGLAAMPLSINPERVASCGVSYETPLGFARQCDSLPWNRYLFPSPCVYACGRRKKMIIPLIPSRKRLG